LDEICNTLCFICYRSYLLVQQKINGKGKQGENGAMYYVFKVCNDLLMQ